MDLTLPTPAPGVRALALATPPIACIAPAGTFDDFGWNTSRTMEAWIPAAGLTLDRVDRHGSTRTVLVLRESWDAVPSELARLHVGKHWGLGDSLCLAPYGIDDATDGLHTARRDADRTFFLVTDNLNGLHWSLHDWAHFHSHGPFTDPTATELQCDAAALVWLHLNRAALGLDEATWDRVRAEVAAVQRWRMEDRPSPAMPDPGWLEDPHRLLSLVPPAFRGTGTREHGPTGP